jgi:hypothetical protein
MELTVRFVLGGLIVSAFAVLGDLFKPKSFAGLFGAAPSVALASLGLTFQPHGGSYTAIEGLAMMAGAVGLFAYSLLTRRLIAQPNLNAWMSAGISWIAWAVVAFGLWALLLRGVA